MALSFGRKPRNQQFEDAAVGMLASALAQRGVVPMIPAPGAPGHLVMPSGFHLSVNNLVDALRESSTDQWDEVVARQADALATLEFQGDDELAEAAFVADMEASLRTQLVPAQSIAPLNIGYARPVADGLALVLCIDFDHRVETVDDDLARHLPMDINRAFLIGQSNTDDVAVGGTRAVLGDVTMIHGDSPFIAAKVAHMPSLLDQHIGPAPQGVLFGVVSAHTIHYRVVDPAAGPAQVRDMAWLVLNAAYDSHIPKPGGVLSPRTFWWSPDDAILPVSDLLDDGSGLEGRDRFVVNPPSALVELLQQ